MITPSRVFAAAAKTRARCSGMSRRRLPRCRYAFDDEPPPLLRAAPMIERRCRGAVGDGPFIATHFVAADD